MSADKRKSTAFGLLAFSVVLGGTGAIFFQGSKNATQDYTTFKTVKVCSNFDAAVREGDGSFVLLQGPVSLPPEYPTLTSKYGKDSFERPYRCLAREIEVEQISKKRSSPQEPWVKHVNLHSREWKAPPYLICQGEHWFQSLLKKADQPASQIDLVRIRITKIPWNKQEGLGLQKVSDFLSQPDSVKVLNILSDDNEVIAGFRTVERIVPVQTMTAVGVLRYRDGSWGLFKDHKKPYFLTTLTPTEIKSELKSRGDTLKIAAGVFGVCSGVVALASAAMFFGVINP